jgi:hypothetical protein
MGNFGLLRDKINYLVSEAIVLKTNSGKEIFKNYLKLLRENEILKTQFLVYKNIETLCESDETKALLLINENIGLLSNYDKNDIKKANKLLETLVKKYNINPYPNGDNLKELHENISNVIINKKTNKTILPIIESITEILNFVKNNKETKNEKPLFESILPNSVMATILIDRFNNEYSSVTEDEKKIISLLIKNDENENEFIFNETVKQCLLIVNEKLINSDIVLKESLLSAKEILLNKKYSNETFQKDMTKLFDLKNDLKEN